MNNEYGKLKNEEYKAKTLPIVVDRIFTLVEATGFEPAAFWSRTKRATKLRYASTWSQRGDSDP